MLNRWAASRLNPRRDAWRFVWSPKSPWVERRFEDLVFDFVIVTEERTLRPRLFAGK
jgi:hypothetical protein